MLDNYFVVVAVDKRHATFRLCQQMGVCYEMACRWYRDGEIQGRSIEVVNQATTDQEDLMADLTAILYSFTAHLYGQLWAAMGSYGQLWAAASEAQNRGGHSGAGSGGK